MGVKFMDISNGSLIIAYEDGQLQCWNFATRKNERFTLSSGITDGCIFKDRYVLFLTHDSILIVFDMEQFTEFVHFSASDLGSPEHNGFHSIESKRNGTEIILSGKNRVLRVASLDLDKREILLKFKLQNAVDRCSWSDAGFSQLSTFDSSFTFAAAATKGKHLIYIWDNSTSDLVQKIEGPNEEAVQVLWNPNKLQLYSVGALTGKIYISGPQFPQKWSALVPNVEAIETNIEYIEREDEFDLPVEDEIARNREVDESIELDLDSFKTPTVSVAKCSTLLYPL